MGKTASCKELQHKMELSIESWKRFKLDREQETWGADLLLMLAGLSIDKAKWMFLGCNQ